MNQKSRFSEMLIAFCVCTACITIFEGVMGALFFPEERLGYDAFFSPPIFGGLSILSGVVTWSKKELSIMQVLFRRGIHLSLIEGIVFGLNCACGRVFRLGVNIVLGFGIALLFVMVYVILWVNDKKSAELFNQKLKEYQAVSLSESEPPV